MCEFIVCMSRDIVLLDCDPRSTLCKSRKFFFADLSWRMEVKHFFSEFLERIQLNLLVTEFLFNSKNHQPDATIFQFIILMFVYSSTCFRRFPAHHKELNDCSGSLCFYLCIVVIVVLCSW